MNFTRFASAAAIAACLSAPASLASAQEAWDMALAYSASNYHSQNAQLFADLVEEKTDGALTITTHPSGSLYKGNEIFRAVRTNQIAIGERFMSALGNENPVLEVDAIPFLATSFEDARSLYEASRPTVEAALEDMGVKLLYAVPWPPQGLYSADPINSADDLNGARFRATNQMTTRLAELMGAQPTKIEAAEMSNAFATGVVNSMMTSAATGVDRSMWEYIPVFTDVQAAIPKNVVVVNLEVWNNLSSDVQAAVEEAAAEAERNGWRLATELAESAKSTLSENGMTVAQPSEELSAALPEFGTQLTQEWLERAGENGTAIIDAYRN
ncbi:TRAP transporter substrate-binding protein [uncultured Tateyamaria sp.]|uniref:TRAP transporter substrate-binding protein n=1 Tax=uncultured Tateyamaria sp. TaxID=455651 RepID=UPI00260F678E|nr:TRAP transporter substrate-binding protein [uncultured Tateyamaria sp.]